MGLAGADDAIGAEDVCAVITGWAGEDGHVLDHAEDLTRGEGL